MASASNQAGVFGGSNPSEYNASDPIVLWIIQLVIIIVFCRILYYPLSFIRQPKVIAEVIGGVLLGPSVLGRIPNFNQTIFPAASIPGLTLTANIGLVFFLFLVGLELDLSLMAKNLKIAGSVAVAGMVLPFGCGFAIAYGLYHNFHEADEAGIQDRISFGLYGLFVGVALAITAFPVLARILSELKLLGTTVGTIVLSAGVGNDVAGWILLALTVALVNSSSGIVALWVLLVAVGWVVFLMVLVRPALRWLVRRTGSFENGPTELVMISIFLLVMISAFMTDIIGVHPIFGGFVAGLVVPHEKGFAVKITEKIEDIISLFFLPLYFTLSGLKTNLGLLDDGQTWAYTIAIIVIAMATKIIGSSVAARLSGLLWRESLAVGTLMSCKGLVELIVLNVGLQAGILSQRVFTMFVVMALICTFITTPATMSVYPASYQRKVAAWRRGDIDWSDEVQSIRRVSSDTIYPAAPTRLTILLSRVDSALVAFLDLLIPRSEKECMLVHAVDIRELTDRTSSRMRISAEEYQDLDSSVHSFMSIAPVWRSAIVNGDVAIVPEVDFPAAVNEHLDNAELVIAPYKSSDYHSHRIVNSALQNSCNLAILVPNDAKISIKHVVVLYAGSSDDVLLTHILTKFVFHGGNVTSTIIVLNEVETVPEFGSYATVKKWDHQESITDIITTESPDLVVVGHNSIIGMAKTDRSSIATTDLETKSILGELGHLVARWGNSSLVIFRAA
ncbi:Sodium/hydrogen exchanger family-domain-containing protein [Lipomyces japonicus]|uniref:Sodium/hydrogen exchanger family-domain-containing protein n=1 Tax=Lipomyces japonicus TaxID=56871 RepID=UPI0034CF8ABC